jgi:hypothetical protein
MHQRWIIWNMNMLVIDDEVDAFEISQISVMHLEKMNMNG